MKKGFTLVELLAVIVILGAMAALASQTIIKNIADSKDKAYQVTIKSIESATEVYMTNHAGEYDSIDIPGTVIYVEVGDLIEDGLIDDPVINSKTGKEVSPAVKVKVEVIAAGQIDIHFIPDFSPTVISFEPNGSASVDDISTIVRVADDDGVNLSSLKYLWRTTNSAPDQESFSSTFTNGTSISSPVGVAGNYYLWILAMDNKNNVTISGSNLFVLQ